MQASCSVRLLKPFIKLVSAHAAHRDLVPPDFWSVRDDARVSLAATHTMLDCGVERLRDQELGLKLGRMMSLGAGGPFDYVVRSAATVRESVDVASRYARLLTDSFHVSFETWQSHALIRLGDGPAWPKPAADFAMSAFYKLHVSEQLAASHLECWFPYSTPRDTSAYERLFAGAALKFGAPFHGFAFSRAYAEMPLPGADPGLHSILRSRVDSLLTALSVSQSVAAVVRRLVTAELPSGNPTADNVARTLHMSRRTLTRKLEQEHTTFNAELDGVRRVLALEHVGGGETPLTEVAFLVGFSHVESFHRAFKRWTGATPVAYRTLHFSGS